jgi:hypothetical protein
MREQPPGWPAPPPGGHAYPPPPPPPGGALPPPPPYAAGAPYAPYAPPGYPGNYYGFDPAFDQQITKDANKVLVLGLVSLLICGPLGLAAIFEGNKVRKQTAAYGLAEPGSSKAGRILGIIALVWMVAVILFVIVGAAAAPDPQPYYQGY